MHDIKKPDLFREIVTLSDLTDSLEEILKSIHTDVFDLINTTDLLNLLFSSPL